MANLSETLTGIVSGDNHEIIRGVDNIAPGQSIVEAWFTVKEDFWETDEVFQKHITTVDAPSSGVINDTGDTDTVAHMRFNLLPVDTLLLSPFFQYVYDIQVKTDIGNIYTPEIGTLTTTAAITLEA